MLVEKKDKILIGITGNIASGKSTIRRMFERDDLFLTVDSDNIAKLYLFSDKEIREELSKYLKKDVFRADGSIDTALLAATAFGDRELMRRLEGILHPLVIRDIQSIINKAQKPIIIVESALIFETDVYTMLDRVITVFADEETRVRRLIRRTGISKEEAIKRVKFQTSEYLKILRSDYVIDNSGDKRWLSCQVENIKQDILKEYKYVKNRQV